MAAGMERQPGRSAAVLAKFAMAFVRHWISMIRQGEALVFGPAISADGAVAIQVAKPIPQSIRERAGDSI